jgi:hypothetical protein
MHVREIISTHPDVKGSVNDRLLRCIEECYDCAQACTSCADACLAEEMVPQLRPCIRLCLDCADVCAMTGSLASRRSGSNQALLRQAIAFCAEASHLCGSECERHAAHHEHCRICAEACRRCLDACREAVGTIH